MTKEWKISLGIIALLIATGLTLTRVEGTGWQYMTLAWAQMLVIIWVAS